MDSPASGAIIARLSAIGRWRAARLENRTRPVAGRSSDAEDFVAQSHTPIDHCVRFAVVVTFPDATLITRRALPLTWAGLSPAGSRQLRLAHCYSFTAVDFHHILLASLPAHSLALRPAHSHGHRMS